MIPAEYRETSNIRRSLIANKLVDHSDVVGASPVGAVPTSIVILDLTPDFNEIEKKKTTGRLDEKHLRFGVWCDLY